MNKLISPTKLEVGTTIRVVNREWKIASALPNIAPEIYHYFIIPIGEVRPERKATPNYTNTEQLRRYVKAIERARVFNNKPKETLKCSKEN